MKTTIRLNRTHYVFVDWKNNNLSMSGVVGPRADGDCHGGCGQIKKEVKKLLDDPLGKLLVPKEKIQRIVDIWENYHLNDMQAGCEHQRQLGWDKIPIDPAKPLDAYGKYYPNQEGATWNMMVWVTPEEFPGGLLTAECPVCGYRYGTKWLRKEVPQEAVDFLFSLPNTPAPGAWSR